MDVRVHGKDTKLDDELRALAEDKVAHAARIFDDGGIADVEFVENHNPRMADGKYRVEITAPVAGQVVRVESAAPDARAALDFAVDKFERQLRKLKTRLIQRSRRNNNKHLNAVSEVSEESDEEGPVIVRTKRFAMKPMSPEEAALQMEMLGHDFFFFMNAETGDYNVLYHRRDGSYGLIEPA